MSGRPFVFLLFLLFVIAGFVFNWWPGKEDGVRYYDAFVSFTWMPSTAYVEGHYDAVSGTMSGWIRQGEHAAQTLLAGPYGDVVRRSLIGYAFFAVISVLLPSYRKGVRELLDIDDLRGIVGLLIVFLGLTSLSLWAFLSAPGFQPNSGDENEPFYRLLTAVLALLGLPSFLGIAIIGLSSVIWVPAILLYLPGAVFLFVSFVLRVGFLVLTSPVKALLFLWHSLHYLFVPHPAEVVYREGMRNNVPIPILAANVADILYQQDFDGFREKGYPPAWVSKNQEKRIRALHEEVRAGNEFMDELKRNIRLRNELQV